MNFEKFIFPSEILFRFNFDGTAIQGCHMRNLEVLKDTSSGAIYSAKELDPQPISGIAMDNVLGLVNTALTASLVAAENECATINELLTQERDAVGDLTSKNDALSQALFNANARIAELEALHAGA